MFIGIKNDTLDHYTINVWFMSSTNCVINQKIFKGLGILKNLDHYTRNMWFISSTNCVINPKKNWHNNCW